MEVVSVILLSLCGAALAVSGFMLVRNNWVYRVRMDLIDSDWEAYQRLPSYGAMLNRFWVWDIKTFLGGRS